MNTNLQVELGKLFFEEGLPGFSHLQFFQLVQEDESPFFVIQSVEDNSVSFWVVNPFSFFPDYHFTLSPLTKSLLRIEEEKSISVFTIVTLRGNESITVNLKAPIVINLSNRMSRQIILQDELYSIRQPLFGKQTTAKG